MPPSTSRTNPAPAPPPEPQPETADTQPTEAAPLTLKRRSPEDLAAMGLHAPTTAAHDLTPKSPPSFSETLALLSDRLTARPSDNEALDALTLHLPKATTEPDRIAAVHAALHILTSPHLSLSRRQIRTLTHHTLTHLLSLPPSHLSTLLSTATAIALGTLHL